MSITEQQTLTALRTVVNKNPRRTNGPKLAYANGRNKPADLTAAIVAELGLPVARLNGAGPIASERALFGALGFDGPAIDLLERAQGIADTRYGTAIGRLGWRSVYALVLNGVGVT